MVKLIRYIPLPHTWMGFGIPRRSSKELMESPMPPWMHRISPCHFECQPSNSQLGKRKEIFKCQIIWNLQWHHFINRSIMKTSCPPTRAEMGRNSNTSFTPEIFQRLIQHSCNGLQLPVFGYINNWDRCVPTYHLHLDQTSSQAISAAYHTHQRRHGWHQWHDRCTPRTIRMETIIHVHQTILSTNPGLRQWNQWREKKVCNSENCQASWFPRTKKILEGYKTFKAKSKETTSHLSSVFKLTRIWENVLVSQCQDTNRLLGRRNLPGRP